MSLYKRLHEAENVAPASRRDPVLDELRQKIHHHLIEELGPILYDKRLSEEELRRRVTEQLQSALARERAPLSAADKVQLIQDVSDDVLGYGPIDPYLRDADVTEVMVNGPDLVYVERAGKVMKAPASFVDEAHLRRIIDKIVGQVGRRIDEANPLCDARLPDGSRVNAVISPLAIGGPFLTIRKFAADPFGVEDLIGFGTLNPQTARFLEACVVGRLNVIVSGAPALVRRQLSTSCRASSLLTSGSSPSRTPRSCNSSRSTCCRSRPVRRTSRDVARSPSATWSRTHYGCGPSASSWASAVAARPSTCCRP
jgi:hypothetical protein